MYAKYLACAGVAAAAMMLPAAAQADENDVLICSPASNPGALVTGTVDTITGAIVLPHRVFAETADVLAGVDDFRGDEGFFSVSDPGLLPPGYVPPPGNVDIRFDFRTLTISGQTANLWYWDPAAHPAVRFEPAAGGQRLSFRKSPTQFFTATVDGAAVDVAGFVIDRTSAGGALHKHLSIAVDDGDDDLGTPVRAGVYVAAYVLSHAGGASPLVIEVVNGGLGAAGESAVQQAVLFFERYLNPCVGDLNGNGAVDLGDLTTMLAHFGTATGALPGDGDLDGDGDVDLNDLAALLARFGAIC